MGVDTVTRARQDSLGSATHKKKNTVYRIDCTLCPEGQSFYIGESRRSIRKRFNEHLGDARNRRADSPFEIHQNDHTNTTLTCQNLRIKILARATDGPDRKIKESIYVGISTILDPRQCLAMPASSS